MATSVFINEFHYDNDGTDTGEAIEILGPAGTDLTGWSIVRYNGNGGAVYTTPAANETLSGTIPDQGNGFGTVVITYPPSGIQIGSQDDIALVDNNNNVIQFLSYEGAFTAVGGPADGLTSTDIGVAETRDTPVGSSLQLVGTGTTYEDFTWQTPADDSFGFVNSGQSFTGGGSDSEPKITPIYDIQGAGHNSSFEGQTVTTTGIVTAVDSNGFYLQDPQGDGNTDTSDGIFVFTRTTPAVAVGDELQVAGTVSEFIPGGADTNNLSITQLTSPTITILSRDNPLPAATVLGAGGRTPPTQIIDNDNFSP